MHITRTYFYPTPLFLYKYFKLNERTLKHGTLRESNRPRPTADPQPPLEGKDSKPTQKSHHFPNTDTPREQRCTKGNLYTGQIPINHRGDKGPAGGTPSPPSGELSFAPDEQKAPSSPVKQRFTMCGSFVYVRRQWNAIFDFEPFRYSVLVTAFSCFYAGDPLFGACMVSVWDWGVRWLRYLQVMGIDSLLGFGDVVDRFSEGKYGELPYNDCTKVWDPLVCEL